MQVTFSKCHMLKSWINGQSDIQQVHVRRSQREMHANARQQKITYAGICSWPADICKCHNSSTRVLADWRIRTADLPQERSGEADLENFCAHATHAQLAL